MKATHIRYKLRVKFSTSEGKSHSVSLCLLRESDSLRTHNPSGGVDTVDGACTLIEVSTENE